MTDVDTPDAPFRLADMSPPRRLRWLIPLLLAAATLLGGGTVAFVAFGSADETPTTPVAATSAAVILSEKEACAKLDPLLLRASEIWSNYAKNGVVPPREEAFALRTQIREVQKVAPADMGPDLDTQTATLARLAGGGIGVDGEAVSETGIRLVSRCNRAALRP